LTFGTKTGTPVTYTNFNFYTSFCSRVELIGTDGQEPQCSPLQRPQINANAAQCGDLFVHGVQLWWNGQHSSE